MADIKAGIEYAKQNPDSAFATELRKRIESGSFNKELTDAGLTQFIPKNPTPTEKTGTDTGNDIRETGTAIKEIFNKNKEKAAQTTADYKSGDQGLASSLIQGVGQAANTLGGAIGEIGTGIGKVVLPQKAEDAVGKGVGYVVGEVANTLKNDEGVQNVTSAFRSWAEKHPEAAKNLGAVVDIASILPIGELAGQTVKKTASVAKNSLNAVEDVATSVANRTKNAVVKATETIMPENRTANKAFKSAIDPVVTEKISVNPVLKSTVKEAEKQGFDPKDINFLASVSDTDKPALKEMFDLTVKAQSDPRQIVRAGDKLGDNVVNQVRQVQALNSTAGKAVDETAKALKGIAVDVAPLKNSIISTLDNAGIKITEDGVLDFGGSVFKNTPKLQKEIARVIRSVPDGSDANQLHIFKKSIDELVDYGTAGEGLTGRSANILKSIRNSADEILDGNFPDYNAANTNYKYTRDFIDEAKTIAGKNADLSTKEGAQAFGQALRGAFSNNKTRGNVLTFIENAQKVGKELGLSGADQNILDQAIFVQILENTFGSPAATGLAGEVSKGIKKVQRGIDIVRNPITGVPGAIADMVENARNITPEAKKKVLQMFLD